MAASVDIGKVSKAGKPILGISLPGGTNPARRVSGNDTRTGRTSGSDIFGPRIWDGLNRNSGGGYGGNSDMNSSEDLWKMFESMLDGLEPDPEEEAAAAAASQAEYDARMAEQARVTALTERDSLYSSYMDAAGSAADYVNSEITREQANANLLGIEYGITDQQKKQRVSDYFATLWGEGEQTRLEALMSEWGNPEGFESFQVTRGDGSVYAAKEGTEVSAGRSAGMKPKVLTQDDEESLGAQTNLLGA